MPIYEYRCSECSFEMERLQPIGADPPDCPDCHIKMSRLPSSGGMVKIMGMGGYPSRRKMINDTAPYLKSSRRRFRNGKNN